MATLTLQQHLKSQSDAGLRNYALFLGGLDVTRDVLQSYDPFKTGFARIFMVRQPVFVRNAISDKMLNFKHMIEYANTAISGIGDIDVQTEQMTGGFAGRSFQIPTIATDGTQNLTITVYEFSGSPIREVLWFWITGVSDLQSGFSTYHVSGENDPNADLPVRQSNHTAEFVYAVTDQSGRAENCEYACMFANCFPTNIQMDHLNYTAGQHEVVQYQIQFTCTKYESPQINNIAVQLLKKHKILMDSLDFNPKLGDISSDTEYKGTTHKNSLSYTTEYDSNTGMLVRK